MQEEKWRLTELPNCETCKQNRSMEEKKGKIDKALDIIFKISVTIVLISVGYIFFYCEGAEEGYRQGLAENLQQDNSSAWEEVYSMGFEGYMNVDKQMEEMSNNDNIPEYMKNYFELRYLLLKTGKGNKLKGSMDLLNDLEKLQSQVEETM